MGRLLVAAVAMVCVGCGGGDRPRPETGGEVCVDLGEVVCARAIECGLAVGTQAACVNDFRAACCGDDGTCNNSVKEDLTAAEWNDCLDDYEVISCTDLDNGDAPSSCLRI